MSFRFRPDMEAAPWAAFVHLRSSVFSTFAPDRHGIRLTLIMVDEASPRGNSFPAPTRRYSYQFSSHDLTGLEEMEFNRRRARGLCSPASAMSFFVF
jgi:hypothetical protein